MLGFTTSYFCNGWNWTHLSFGALLPVFLAAVFRNSNPAQFLVITLLLDVIKELLDSVAAHIGSTFMFRVGFDPAGGDYRDVIMCFIGILISTFMLWRLA